MPQLVEYIDTIAKRLGRPVLLARFGRNAFDGLSEGIQEKRAAFLTQLDDAVVVYTACGPHSQSGWSLSYLGDVYFPDVEYVPGEPRYERLRRLFETEAGELLDPRVRFCLYQQNAVRGAGEGGLAEQDTDEAALAGKLLRSESAVQEAFRRIDRLVAETLGSVDRRSIRKGGEWAGRSYWLGRKRLLRLDLKGGFVRAWVGSDAYAEAPPALKGDYLQDDWLIVKPGDLDLGLAYIGRVLRSRAEAGS